MSFASQFVGRSPMNEWVIAIRPTGHPGALYSSSAMPDGFARGGRVGNGQRNLDSLDRSRIG